jgi:protein-tyrosine-phosphatase
MSDRDGEVIRIAFVCVRNAGRSQMAAAFAECERAERDLDDSIEILTGGTRPADRVHEEVLEAMGEEGIDLSARIPREITTAELDSCEYVATMGCSTLDASKAGSGVEIRDWALDDPDGRDTEAVRAIREEIRERVGALFEEIAADRPAVTRK